MAMSLMSYSAERNGAEGRLPPDVLRIAVAGPGRHNNNGSSSPSRHPKPTNEPPAGCAFVLRKIRARLESNGPTGYVHLHRLVRAFARPSINNPRRPLPTLTVAGLKQVLERLGGGDTDDFSAGEVRMLFDSYGMLQDHQDTRDRNALNVAAFLTAVRPPLAGRRLAAVLRAFTRLDTDGDGRVSADDIAANYDAAQHPEVLAGRMSTDDALGQFLESFDVGAEVDGHVTQAEFVEYYTNVGAAITNDEYFLLLVGGVWHVPHEVIAAPPPPPPPSQQQQQPRGMTEQEQHAKGPVPLRAATTVALPGSPARPPRAPASAPVPTALPPPPPPPPPPPRPMTAGVAYVAAKLKTALRKGHGYLGLVILERCLRDVADIAESGCLVTLHGFKTALRDAAPGALTDTEHRQLYDHHAHDVAPRVLAHPDLMATLRGPWPPRRLRAVHAAYARLDGINAGVVDASLVASAYEPAYHPDVMAGQRGADAVLTELLSTFDVRTEAVTRSAPPSYPLTPPTHQTPSPVHHSNAHRTHEP